MPIIKFHQSGKFSTKIGKFSTSAECYNSCNSAKNFFCLVHNFVSGIFSTKVEKIPISLLGMKFGKREGLDAGNKISPNVPIHAILQKFFVFLQIFESGKFAPKWKNFLFSNWG